MRLTLAAVALSIAFTTAVPAAQSGQERVYRPGSGVTDPVLVKQVHPKYTADAMRAHIQGVVELEAVVLANGTVGDVHVVRSLDTRYGLDDQAVAAAREWLFRPGQYQDRPVPVLVTLILEFRSHANRIDPPAQEDEFTRGTHRADDQRVVPPKVVKSVAPRYTADAMRARIQGIVEVEVVVLEDGTVGRARVKASLDAVHGLDASALDAAAQYDFEPGTLDDKPVPVLLTLRLEFRLH